MRSSSLLATIVAFGYGQAVNPVPGDNGLRVNTTIGNFEGLIDRDYPRVKQWLGIPFAEPPVGPLRWQPPIAKAQIESSNLVQAKTAPNSCAQFLTPGASIFNDLVPEFNTPRPYSEDCLYLNIIAPETECEELLPVLVWLHGGELQFGGLDVPYQMPQNWVQRSQGHIVVQINFRLNIFGFPNSNGLKDSNLGILDQRLALEWIRDNIEHFGGDSQRITVWGQSAGAAAIDAHQFAWPSDPIFNSLILQSGVVFVADTTEDLNRTSFSYVAKQLGCPHNASAEEEVEFLRGIDAEVIETFLLNVSISEDRPPLYFSAQADGKIAFTSDEYLTMGTAGSFANVPLLIGTNSDEGSSFVPFSLDSTVPRKTIDEATLNIIQCPVAKSCNYREASGRVTYRYQYSGNFTNVSPVNWIGAYHFAELPLIMGTHSKYRNPSTEFETRLSHKMQDLWLAFANDPWNGLEAHGWSRYSSNGTALTLGKENTLVSISSIQALDSECSMA